MGVVDWDTPEARVNCSLSSTLVLPLALQGSFLTKNSSRAHHPPPTRTMTVDLRIRTRRSFCESPNLYFPSPTGRTVVPSPTPRGLTTRSRGKWPSAPADRSSRCSKSEKENTGSETHRSCVLSVSSDPPSWSVSEEDGAPLTSSWSRTILAEVSQTHQNTQQTSNG